MMQVSPGADKTYIFTQILVLAGLLATLYMGLLPVLLAGLLVFHLVEFGVRMLGHAGVIPSTGRIILIVAITLIIITGFSLGVRAFLSHIANGPESFALLLRKMADAIDTARSYMPVWVQQYLPANIEEWQEEISDWLRNNARDFGMAGREAVLFLAHIIIGMIIGGMVALNPGFQEIHGPLAQGLSERLEFIGNAFRRIVFSQIRISAINTFLTALFITIILPVFGSPMPFPATIIMITFFAGLLPIVGNLISNTVIFLIGLSVSPGVAISSLLYLVVIHKLEYFLNAHIIGTQIRSRAWEILLAMLVMETAFGIAGLVAAPIYYAYIKDELSARKLI